MHTGPVPAAQILVVDDDEQIRELLESILTFAGFDVTLSNDATSALDVLRGQHIDAVVLDVMLPGIDGFELVRVLRAHGDLTPVLFLTAKQDVDDRIRGLRVGGDDYVTKPFSVAEVAARVEALLRRTGPRSTSDDGRMRVGDLTIDPGSVRVTRGEREISLSPTEFRLLEYLFTHPGQVLSKSQILRHVWGYDFGGDANVVERFISNLRRKIDDGGQPAVIHTVRGFGYSARVDG